MNLPSQVERRHPRLDVAVQFAMILGAALVYFFVRGITEGSVERANANAETVLQVERWLGIEVEEAAQGLVLDHEMLVTLANWVYIWGHWPAIAVTLYLLHRRRSPQYLLLRNAMFVSGAIGIVLFIAFPVAPPRLLDAAFTDTVTELSTSYRVLQPPALVNKFAAMPSLHVGWNLLAGIAIYRATRHRGLRGLAIAGPLAMTLAVVLTANHYVLDAVAGAAVALAGLLAAQALWRLLYEPRLPGRTERIIDLRDEVEVIDDQAGHAELSQATSAR